MIRKPASRICYAADADDFYMGYADRDELLFALNILLEAERAGARVALASAKYAGAPAYAELVRAVRVDEARWCAMLSRQIRRLGGTSSRKTGAFHAKAVAIADPRERLAFLNHGQAWVARKLEALIRRVRDDRLHADLRAMLDSHRINIDRVDRFLSDHRPPTPGTGADAILPNGSRSL